MIDFCIPHEVFYRVNFLGFKKCCTRWGSWNGEVCQRCNERKENWAGGYGVRLEPEHKFFNGRQFWLLGAFLQLLNLIQYLGHSAQIFRMKLENKVMVTSSSVLENKLQSFNWHGFGITASLSCKSLLLLLISK